MNAAQELIERQRSTIEALDAELARETACTPRELVHASGTLRLYHYLPQTPDVYRTPLLIVMSLVSKPDIFDLTPGQSFIEHLVQAGFDVYLVDWGLPRAEHGKLGIDAYVADLLPACIAEVQAHSGEERITLVGYCLGGIFTTLYAARENQGPLRNLLLLATPINGHGMVLQRRLLSSQGLDPDLLVDTLGNIPSSMIEGAFQMLRPLQKASGQATLLNNLHDREFAKAHLRIVRWGAQALPFPGEAFRQLAKDFVLNNRIVEGGLDVRGVRCSLDRIRVPLLHVVAEHDHVVPRDASSDLVRLAGSKDKDELVIKGGHVSLVAGVGAATRTWPRIVQWLAPRST
ncbi:Poly-beta-hydroxybutyrate polymerase (fragment) [Burkholderiales bacterium 8X]